MGNRVWWRTSADLEERADVTIPVEESGGRGLRLGKRSLGAVGTGTFNSGNSVLSIKGLGGRATEETVVVQGVRGTEIVVSETVTL